MQLHAARARHYDLRLEEDGVLKSWAVPKGPSPNPREKRLAMHVEDHPVEYAGFEGVIPAGNYGAGAMIVWDRGRYVPLIDPREGFEKGKLLFELRGFKLRGKWTLVKTKRGKNEWLLIKERDVYASEATTGDYPEGSVLSGRTVEQLARGEDLEAPLRGRLERLGAPRRTLDARRLTPMLATPGKPFSREGWLFELKYDGYRLLAEKEGDRVVLRSRAGNDLTAVFPDLAELVAALPVRSFVIDGEAVVADERGVPRFALLQKRARLTRRTDIERAALELPVTFYAFDLLTLVGHDLRALPLSSRKELLRSFLPEVGAIRYSEHVEREGEALFDEAERMGLEGVVGKRASSAYVMKRSVDWIKVNAAESDDFVVCGFVRGKNHSGVSALLLAQHRDGALVYAGRVGTGFTQRESQELLRLLEALPKAEPPTGAPAERAAVWIANGPVVQVKYKHRAQEALRQPVYLRRRTDKKPEECRWPELRSDERELAASPRAPDPAPERPRVEITNPAKVFWPKERYTKGDLIEYYAAISPWLLPYLKDRPVVLTRYPDGIEGKSFFQKDAPAHAPDWLRLETMWSEHAAREIRYFVLDDLDSLLYVINLGTIPLHVWSSRVATLERPDWCILDLDPKGAPLAHVVRIARYLHELCTSVGAPAFVKTSGSTGLHVLIPLGARYTYEQSRTLGELLARFAVQALPEIATIERTIEDRDGKVYIDYLQNGHGKLLVGPFSARPLPGAPVSFPLRWSQVNARLRLARYTIANAAREMAASGDPLAGVLGQSIDMLAVLRALAGRLDHAREGSRPKRSE